MSIAILRRSDGGREQEQEQGATAQTSSQVGTLVGNKPQNLLRGPRLLSSPDDGFQSAACYIAQRRHAATNHLAAMAAAGKPLGWHAVQPTKLDWQTTTLQSARPTQSYKSLPTSTEQLIIQLEQSSFNRTCMDAATPWLPAQPPLPDRPHTMNMEPVLGARDVPSKNALRILLAVANFNAIADSAACAQPTRLRAKKRRGVAPPVQCTGDDGVVAAAYSGSQCWAAGWGHQHGEEVAFDECLPAYLSPESEPPTPRPARPVCCHKPAVTESPAIIWDYFCPTPPSNATVTCMPAAKDAHAHMDPAMVNLEGSIFDLYDVLVQSGSSKASSERSSLSSYSSSDLASRCSSVTDSSNAAPAVKPGKLSAQLAALRAPPPAPPKQASKGLLSRFCKWLFD